MGLIFLPRWEMRPKEKGLATDAANPLFFELARKDLNLERRNQNPLCCQLHHGPIEVGICHKLAFSSTRL